MGAAKRTLDGEDGSERMRKERKARAKYWRTLRAQKWPIAHCHRHSLFWEFLSKLPMRSRYVRVWPTRFRLPRQHSCHHGSLYRLPRRGRRPLVMSRPLLFLGDRPKRRIQAFDTRWWALSIGPFCFRAECRRDARTGNLIVHVLSFAARVPLLQGYWPYYHRQLVSRMIGLRH